MDKETLEKIKAYMDSKEEYLEYFPYIFVEDLKEYLESLVNQ